MSSLEPAPSPPPLARVDGPEKVSGAARYAAEFPAPGLLHGRVVSAAIARGRIASIDAAAANAVPGVVRVFTHQNRPHKAWFHSRHHDEAAPAGAPLRPLRDARVRFSGQPVALVVAEDPDAARHAASLVRVRYAAQPHRTALDAVRLARGGRARPESTPPSPRGDAARALRRAALRVDREYRVAVEHHNPIEPHASTVIVGADGALTVHDKTQGVINTRDFVA